MKRLISRGSIWGTCMLSAVMMLLTGCSQENPPAIEGTAVSESVYLSVSKLTDADTNVSLENAGEIIADGAQSTYIIDEPGDYLLKGKYEGQLQIDVEDEIVHLILEDAELTPKEGPAIYVKSAAKVVITIPENSSSVLVDSANYKESANAKACLYSEADLTINGGGNLRVYGYYKDAIRTKDTLKILDIQLTVQAKGDGLRGNDGVLLQTKALEIQCEGTGVYTEKEGKADKGFVSMSGGTVNIIAGRYGVEAAENVYIKDCTANIFGVVQNISCKGNQYIEEGCLE